MSRFLSALLAMMAVASPAWAQPIVDVPPRSAPGFPPLPKKDDGFVPLPKKDDGPPLKSNIPAAPMDIAPIPLPALPGAEPIPVTTTKPVPAGTQVVDNDDSCGCGGCCNAVHCMRAGGQGIQRPLFDFSNWHMPTLFPEVYNTCKMKYAEPRYVLGIVKAAVVAWYVSPGKRAEALSVEESSTSSLLSWSSSER